MNACDDHDADKMKTAISPPTAETNNMMGKQELSIIYAAIVAADSPLEDWMSHAAALKSHMIACHRGYGLRCCWFQTNNSRPSKERLTVSLSAALKNTQQHKHTAHSFQGSLQMFYCKQPQLYQIFLISVTQTVT